MTQATTTRYATYGAGLRALYGGVPAYGNQRSKWDAGCRFDYEDHEYR